MCTNCALLLKQTNEAIGLRDRRTGCVVNGRQAGSVEHSACSTLAQRVFGLALGYEDLNDHETLRANPVFGVMTSKPDESLAGKSMLNRLERFPRRLLSRYHRIRLADEAIEWLLVELFLASHQAATTQIVLDIDATNVSVHGIVRHQTKLLIQVRRPF